jgi:ABC-type sugar transport system ATPase subunit
MGRAEPLQAVLWTFAPYFRIKKLMTQNSAPLLEVQGLGKSYPGVQALSDVDLNVRAGEVHCLIGENGAGKSTMVKIITGVVRPDAGTILIDGRPAEFATPTDSQKAGVACIFQELNVVGGLTIAENIVLGDEPRRAGLFDGQAARKMARRLLDEIGFPRLDEARLCRGLSPAEKQAVMIARALRQNARMIIMDEPTSPLEEAEVRNLFDVIGRLKAAGKGIIYVSHKMREIEELADRVTVFKDGTRVATLSRGEADSAELVRLMVGRPMSDMFPERPHAIGDVVLQARGLTGPRLSAINLTLHRGEVLGIAGLVGAGRTELLRALFGAENLTAGEIRVSDRVVALNSIAASIGVGMALVPEERRSQGIVPVLTVGDNIGLVWDQFPGRRSSAGPRQSAIAQVIASLRVRTPTAAQRIDKLSGGNQQKAVFGKWLLTRTEILLLDEPTRGIDVGAKREIYQIIADLTAKGLAVILVSSELPELLGLADRILVMNSGAVVGELPGDATEEQVIALSMLHAERRAG